MSDREFLISHIRSLLPYMTVEHLKLLRGFTDDLCGGYAAEWSAAERDRTVLSAEEQCQADQAALCMRAIAYSVCPDMGGPFCITSREAVTDDVIGFADGDIIIMDARKVTQARQQNHEKRIKRETLFRYMENAEYILPRHQRPKTIMVNGERREVIYVPVAKFRPFIREGFEARCVREVMG